MQISPKGLAALEHEEGVVLRAYRCPAGVWTIGAGLTAASGVVKPAAGMVITAETATNLLQQALRKNYEPTVMATMAGAKQHEFDAGLGFQFNTGAITRASWVKSWRAKAGAKIIRIELSRWNKGGGKVLPGLERRRAREAAMLLDGVYPVEATRKAPPPPLPAYARWALPLSSGEKLAALDGFRALGYNVGAKLDFAFRDGIEAFQRDHGLTADGVIGRATLSTLQRMLNARASVKTAAPAAAVAPVGFADLTDQLVGVPYIAEAVAAGLAAYAIWEATHYRDAIAPVIQTHLPRVAAFLRSF